MKTLYVLIFAPDQCIRYSAKKQTTIKVPMKKAEKGRKGIILTIGTFYFASSRLKEVRAPEGC